MCDALSRLGARADFERARRGYLAARVGGLVRARRASRTRPRDLGDVDALFWHSARMRPVPLGAIVGTVDPTTDFDAGFRPAADRVSARWQSIARAHRGGRALPPIVVLERPDGYYVLDGRHRVSVARALGHETIDAWASASPSPARTRATPSTREKPMRHRIHNVLSSLTARAAPRRVSALPLRRARPAVPLRTPSLHLPGPPHRAGLTAADRRRSRFRQAESSRARASAPCVTRLSM